MFRLVINPCMQNTHSEQVVHVQASLTNPLLAQFTSIWTIMHQISRFRIPFHTCQYGTYRSFIKPVPDPLVLFRFIRRSTPTGTGNTQKIPTGSGHTIFLPFFGFHNEIFRTKKNLYFSIFYHVIFKSLYYY